MFEWLVKQYTIGTDSITKTIKSYTLDNCITDLKT